MSSFTTITSIRVGLAQHRLKYFHDDIEMILKIYFKLYYYSMTIDLFNHIFKRLNIFTKISYHMRISNLILSTICFINSTGTCNLLMLTIQHAS
jgi:hypothetical protein